MIRKKRDLSPDAKLRFPDYLGYFFGAGTNIAGYIVSAFLLIYYSNVLYLGLTQVGVVMAISKCFDGVSDILMGRIIDKTKSKYGKARPWYLRMILPLSMCMLFCSGCRRDYQRPGNMFMFSLHIILLQRSVLLPMRLHILP